MKYKFKLLKSHNIDIIIPLVLRLNNGKVSEELLKFRFEEMFTQNYECAGVFLDDKLIGVSGLWFCTRHYAGKSVELDHLYIDDEHRSKGLGKLFMEWINDYVYSKGCKSIELNTYVNNYSSHKFYYNQGMEIWGYHFYKNL